MKLERNTCFARGHGVGAGPPLARVRLKLLSDASSQTSSAADPSDRRTDKRTCSGTSSEVENDEEHETADGGTLRVYLTTHRRCLADSEF